MPLDSLVNPTPWLVEPRQHEAVDSLREYLSKYTGRFFEPLAARSDPNRFEADDLVAVSCLSVTVPGDVIGWLLLEEGQQQTAQLLGRMKADRDVGLHEHDITKDDAALELWALLNEQRGLGPTTTSKLMAAKRPHLVPIFDAYVADALLPGWRRHEWTWWKPWRDLLSGPHADELMSALREVRKLAAAADVNVVALSDLRLLDVIIWSTEQRRRRLEGGQ
jgi:Family of unknown function (DUF6308)